MGNIITFKKGSSLRDCCPIFILIKHKQTARAKRSEAKGVKQKNNIYNIPKP